MFAEIVTQRDREPEPEPKASPTAKAEEAPEEPQDAPPVEEPGEEISEEQPPEAVDESAAAEDADETDLSQPDNELTTALAGLNEDAKKHLIEVAQAIAKGETSIGQVKRQLKLGRQENEELAQLREKVKELEAQPPAITTHAALPPTVAKLKTVEEVEQRQELAETSVRAIEDFLEENPQGGAIGDKEFTRAELIQRKRAFQDELKALPKYAQALQQQAQFRHVQSENRKQVLADFPVLNDPENPDTKTAREFLKNPLVANHPTPEYVALALARGHRELQTELAARKTGKVAAALKPGTRPPAATKPGTVPAGKPHAASSAPARSQPASAPVKELLGQVKDKGSFAELLQATGR
jgi:hypothetical protein